MEIDAADILASKIDMEAQLATNKISNVDLKVEITQLKCEIQQIRDEPRKDYEKQLVEMTMEIGNKNNLIVEMEKEIKQSHLKIVYLNNDVDILKNLNLDHKSLKLFLEEKLDYMLLKETQYATHTSQLLQRIINQNQNFKNENSLLTASISKYKITTNLILEWFEMALGKRNEDDELKKLLNLGSELVNKYEDLKEDYVNLLGKFHQNDK
eukprot:NODE_120_length_17920_cov_0.559782.p6 type:complete len:211 gc:universal NODE_120_length_17920_cov_0.559782:6641-7273(+)